MSFCINCGTQLADGSKFCINCGAQQPETAQPVAAAPVVEAPVVAAPVVEAPVVEPAPAPVYEAPVVEPAPAFDPFAQQPVVEQAPAPAFDPFAQQPVAEAPVAEPAPAFDPFAQQPVVAAPATEPAVAPAPAFDPFAQQPAGQAPQPAAPKAEKPKKKKNLGLILGLSIGGGVALITIVAIIIALILTRKTVVDLSKYVEINVTGYDGAGYLEYDYSIDKAQMLKDIMKDKGVKNVDKLKKSDVPDEIYNIVDSMYIDLGDTSKSGKYKNGDTIDVEIIYSDWKIDEAKLKFKNESFSYEVKDLKPLQEYDVFENLEIKFYGTSGSGYLDINEPSDEIYGEIYFESDKSYDLRNGDIINVTVYTYSGDQTGTQYGYKFTTVTKEYIVSGLEKYPANLSEILSEGLKDLKTAAEAEIESEYRSLYGAQMSNLKYVGMYFAKDDDSEYNNYVITVYTATITSDDNDFEPFTVYLPVQQKYIKYGADGKLITDNISSYLKGSFYIDGTWTIIDGYADPYEMYDDMVESNETYYDFEATDSMPDYSEKPQTQVPETSDTPEEDNDDSDGEGEGGLGQGGDEEDAA